MDRHIDFDAIENFRDFGGYDTVCGRGLRRGRLFRSGHHAFASDADLARLKALGVAAVADLRQPTERDREPGRRWDGFDGEVIESSAPSLMPDWVEALKTSSLSAEWWYESTLAHYRMHAFEPRHVEVFRRLLRRIGEHDGAVVVHCAAGKDRTGVACALVHHVAGVPREAMIADYMLTNGDAAMRVAVSVYPAFLDAFFESVTDRCGSMDAYLKEVLGVDAALRQRIHDRILGAG